MHINLDQLNLRFSNTAGHAHRVQPITRRALELLRLRLRNELLASGARLDTLNLETLIVPALNLDMRTLSDEGVAERLAGAMYTALKAHWQDG
jgi:hypothetical protein